MPKFSVGEIAIFVASGVKSAAGERVDQILAMDGEEVEVLDGKRVFDYAEYTVDGYKIKFTDGFVATVTENCLRKKKPPHKDIEETTEALKAGRVDSFQELMKKAKSGELAKTP